MSVEEALTPVTIHEVEGHKRIFVVVGYFTRRWRLAFCKPGLISS